MANPVLPRRSFTPNAVPIAASEISAPGELLINWADGIAYTKDSAGNLISWSLGAASAGSGEDALLRAIFVPPAPTGLTATAGNAQVTLSWTAPTGVIAQAPITDYRKQYSTDNGTTWTTFSAAASTATSATVTGLTNGTVYVFRVAAINAVGVGAYTAASAAVTPVAFAPTYIAGLQLWLDAADASTLFDATTGGSLVAADGGVARWEDKSGNARHMTQGTAGSRPARKAAVQGGLDVLRFDGSNDFLSVASSTATFKFLHSTQATVLFVAKFGVSSNPNAFYALVTTTQAASTEVGAYITFDDRSTVSFNNRMRFVVVRGTSGQVVVNSGADDNATPNVFFLGSFAVDNTAAVAADRVSFRINGGTAEKNNTSTATASSSNSSGDLHVGKSATASSGFMDGDICEIIIYNSVLSAADRVAVENYLLAKWGIT